MSDSDEEKSDSTESDEDDETSGSTDSEDEDEVSDDSEFFHPKPASCLFLNYSTSFFLSPE